MTTDLWMLVASAGLTWVLMMASATPTLLAHPLWALGNRDDPRAPSSTVHARVERAEANLRENLPLFAVLVLVAHAAGASNETTALGSQVFFWARVTHAAVYIAGVPYLRTLIWAVSIGGMAMIVSVLF